MKRQRDIIPKAIHTSAIQLLTWAIASFILLFYSPAQAEPVVLYQSFAGNYNFQMTGASLRTQSNSGNTCAVSAPSSTSQALLTGLPSGAVVRVAYLYWAGSGSTPDNQVVFQGVPTTASRTFTETYAGYDFFSGFADVTSQVNGNGTYGFSGLTVDTGEPFCSVSGVLAGWSLVVFYEHSSEPLRVINLYDGFRYFRDSQITLTPSNFQIPTNGCDALGDCKWGVMTWEGDPDLPIPSELLSRPEELSINGNAITTAANPTGNQFNSTIDLLGTTPSPPGNNTYGVDIDIYPLPSSLSGATSATTRYRSGQDLVLLSAEIFSVRNTPVADLAITKTHSGNFTVGQQGAYTLSVTNNGPADHPGQVTVTDTLPAGLTLASGSGTNWTCGVAGQNVTCTHPGPLANSDNLPDISLTVDVDASAAPSVTNTASVQGTLFDNNAGNNSASDPTNVFDPGPSSGTKLLYFYMTNAPAPDTDTVQRMVNTSQTNTGNITAGGTYTAALSPPTQGTLTLPAGDIDVSLWLRRRNAGGTGSGNGSRNVSVRLDYAGGSNGTLGSVTRNGILGTRRWQYITFTINLAAPVTLNPGTTLQFTLTHGPGSTQGIQSRSANNALTRRSLIAFDTTTVINVDSVDTYSDVAYPGGVVQPSYAHNTNTRIRAVVSDPFGHNDITSASITIINPSSNTVVTSAPMTEVAPLASNPPAATKTYEYLYTLPAGPNGTWTTIVTANEGSEGTVSDLGMGTFLVGMPNLTINKSVTTILKPNSDLSDPSDVDPDAYAIPGAVMRYDIVVTNAGIGPADLNTIEITDPLPADMRLVLNTPMAPAVFIDGDTYGQSASGLVLTRTDVGTNTGPYNDIALSNNGGTSFLLPGAISQTPRGVDSTAPKINYIRINPKGTFAGSTGGPDPSFTIRLRLEIE